MRVKRLSDKTIALAKERNIVAFAGEFDKWKDVMAPVIIAYKLGVPVVLVAYANVSVDPRDRDEMEWMVSKVKPYSDSTARTNSIFYSYAVNEARQSFEGRSTRYDSREIRAYMLESEVEYED